MPLVHIDLLEGRTETQIADLIRGVTDAIVEALDANPESVRIVVSEMRPQHYGVGGKTWPQVVEEHRAAQEAGAG
jgi:4-oxalocrotonate tautomerase